jgi:holdfast attachment protein HfaA
MRHHPIVSRAIGGVLGAVSLLCAGNAAAGGDMSQDFSSGMGYGMSAGEENASISGSTRDANGNRVFINGVEQGVAYPVTDNDPQFSQMFGTQFGVNAGTTTTTAGGSATAIGNALNVTVDGSWNTVIVNSKQTNNGNQNATLNGNLHF